MRIALFALTGFGNPVFRKLIQEGHVPEIIVTREEPNDFPYYSEINLAKEAKAQGVPAYFGQEGERQVLSLKPDVILIATYHRILESKLLSAAKICLNIHPSLLPAYRGASPCYWVLRNGERQTGVSVHYLTEQVDSGPILWQRSIPIEPDETQGTLRKKLAELSGVAAVECLTRLMSSPESFPPEDGSADSRADIGDPGFPLKACGNDTKGSWFPRINEMDRKINFEESAEQIDRHIRGLSPWPGPL